MELVVDDLHGGHCSMLTERSHIRHIRLNSFRCRLTNGTEVLSTSLLSLWPNHNGSPVSKIAPTSETVFLTRSRHAPELTTVLGKKTQAVCYLSHTPAGSAQNVARVQFTCAFVMAGGCRPGGLDSLQAGACWESSPPWAYRESYRSEQKASGWATKQSGRRPAAVCLSKGASNAFIPPGRPSLLAPRTAGSGGSGRMLEALANG